MPDKQYDKLNDEVLGLGTDVVQGVRKLSSRTINIIAGAVLLIFLAVEGISLLLINDASKAALNTAGEMAGDVTGVFKGIVGMPNAYNEGKRQGLSAEDTEAYITNKMSDIGKLEILDAGVKVTNLHKIGNSYANLYISKGNAIFSVDLSTAVIVVNENEITVTLAEPTVEIFIDEQSTESLAEWQKASFTGTTEDGYFAYLNSWNNSREEIEGAIENYDKLINSAKEAGITQIEAIVKACKGKKAKVVVEYKTE